MFALICTMLRRRRFQAIVLTLLASIAFAAAIGFPAYQSAVDASSIATELDHASSAQRVIEMTDNVSVKKGHAPSSDFSTTVAPKMTASSLAVTYAEVTDIEVLGTLPPPVPVLEYRQDVCEHVVLVAGRCLSGGNEVMIDSNLAKTRSLRPGDAIAIAYVSIDTTQGSLVISRVPGDDPITVNVVGVYAPRDASEPYWGDETVFRASSVRDTDAPILTTPATFTALGQLTYTQYVDAVLKPSAVTPATLPMVRAQVQHAMGATYKQDTAPESGILSVLATIDQDRAGAREYLPIMVIPLIGIAWLVVFLASAYAISGRREELGVVALRGATLRSRWWIGTGEALMSVLIAIPIGYVFATVAVRAAVRLLIPHHVATPPIGPGSLAYVAVTLAGCVLAILGAAWRPLRSSPSALLRGVPARAARWRTAALEFLVVAAAIVLVNEVRGQTGRLTVLDQIAPSLAIGAVAIVAARIVMPLATVVGRRGVRHGQRSLGTGIGALQIARRPGTARLFVLMTVAVGMATYVAAGAAVASAGRSDRADVELGGNTVVTVGDVTRLGLVAAVRKADPGGTDAMAVVQIPPQLPSDPRILAVDSSRLAAVAAWPPGGSMSATRAAQILHPRVSKPMFIKGSLLSTAVTVYDDDGSIQHPAISIYVQPLNGNPTEATSLTPIKSGSATYVAAVNCATGCRVAGLDISDPDLSYSTLTVLIHAVQITVPAAGTISGFTSATSWTGTDNTGGGQAPVLSDNHEQLVTTVLSGPSGADAFLVPTDTPNPIPVLSTGVQPGVNTGAIGSDRIGLPVELAATVAALPGLPTGGILMDLEAADRAVPATEDEALDPQVWLSPTAPADMLAKLRSAGLSVVGVARRPPLVAYLAQQGPAVASRFALLTTIGIGFMVIGATVLTASIDRVRRGTELRSLRDQGLSEGSVRRAARFAYLGLGAAAAVAGLVAGLVSWLLTGAKVPVFPDDRAAAGVSIWSAPASLLWPWLAATVVLLAVCGAAASNLRRSVRRGTPDRKSAGAGLLRRIGIGQNGIDQSETGQSETGQNRTVRRTGTGR